MNWLEKVAQLDPSIQGKISKAFFALEEGRKALDVLQSKQYNARPKKPRTMNRSTYDNPIPFIEQVLAKAEEAYRLADEYRKTHSVESWYDDWVNTLFSQKYLLQLNLQRLKR